MSFPRASGILMHPTSLPGRFGIGDFGSKAYEFVDVLAAAGQTYWQIFPLGPTGWGDSPYSSYSAFAGNTLFISPEKLAEDGIIRADDIASPPNFPADRVDYGWVIGWKGTLVASAFESFESGSADEVRNEFDAFTREHGWWLDDYALFRAIKPSHDNKPWYEWPEPLKLRDANALDEARVQLAREIEAEKFAQFLFFRQWFALKSYANDNGVKIIGDIPIFVALDSSDVWCNRYIFKLNDDGSPRVVAGVPPDFFSETGQLWGNPIYDWEVMREWGFSWWTARVEHNLKLADIIRLDHFIGFVRNWEVPARDDTAVNGEWADVPGEELFAVLRERLGDLPAIAEDLGAMTEKVAQVRDSLQFPGMKILQHGFNANAFNGDLPHNYIRNCVAYTGTHDNNTTVGWYRAASKHERAFCRKYLPSNGRGIHWDMVRAILASIADTAIVPAQDIIGLGSEARMNLPATGHDNWKWRLNDGELTEQMAAKLRELTELYGRENR